MLNWTPGWSDLAGGLVAKPTARPPILQRLTRPQPGHAFWIGLGALALAAELGALYPAGAATEPSLASALVSRLVGAPSAAGGLIAWPRRPDSHGGALMLATAAGFMLYPLISQIHAPVAVTLGMWL